MAQRPTEDTVVIENNNRFLIEVHKTEHGTRLHSIHCKSCGSTSWNQNDVEQKYCGKCNMFHD